MLLYQNSINIQKERKIPIGDYHHGCYNQRVLVKVPLFIAYSHPLCFSHTGSTRLVLAMPVAILMVMVSLLASRTWNL